MNNSRWPVAAARLGALALSLILSGGAGAVRAAELTVSAASSLADAFKALAPDFEVRHPGIRLRLNFAASDALLAQIAQGAPVDVFASADADIVERAERRGLLVAGSRQDIARNSLVLVTPRDGGLALQALAELQGPAVRRIAMGRPEGVPAGRYAKAALEAARLWPAVEAKAVYAQNVRQALDYVARGEVEAGFVYATDAAAQHERVRVLLTVPTPMPIRYPVAIVAGSTQPEAARLFIAHLRSPAGQAALAQFGFGRP